MTFWYFEGGGWDNIAVSEWHEGAAIVGFVDGVFRLRF
jgi:hypothetical protein